MPKMIAFDQEAQEAMRRGDLCQRKAAINHRFNLPRLYQLFNVGKIGQAFG